MMRILRNFILNNQKLILSEIRDNNPVVNVRRPYRELPNGFFGQIVNSRNQRKDIIDYDFGRSDHRKRNNQWSEFTRYVLAAPTFLAFFQKKESEDDEPKIWLEKLVPLNIRLMFEKEDESPEGKLVMTLKRAILCIQNNQHNKAEQMIHLALRMAQEMQHADGITLCYDLMANLALETQKFEKAAKLFVAVLQRLLEKGIKQNDAKVLHISLKIAQIAEYRLQPEKAEQGYQWTLNELEREVKHNSDDSDLYELWGLANDYYGKFLLQKSKFAEARVRLSTSYDVYTQIHGKHDSHAVDLLNNLAVVCTNLDDFAAAEMYINEAIHLAQIYPEMFQTGIYHANLGLLYLRKGLLAEARTACALARRMAKEKNDVDGIEQANHCIEQIRGVMA